MVCSVADCVLCSDALTPSSSAAPATAVITTDITTFVMDVGAILFRRDPDEVACARSRARHTWPAIVGFTVGCSIGALLEALIGPWSLVLPAGLALLAIVLGSLKFQRETMRFLNTWAQTRT